MAEQYQQIAVNPGSSQAAIQGTQIVTPALENLMQGISSGMISLGDLQKRNADIPLETAQRNAELTDLKELRPLQRQAQTAQLQNLQAKQAFEAESLPILNDIKREQLKAEYSDVLQHGVPSSTIKIFNATVPGLIPYDPDKLYDKKTGGQLNTSYALELIGKAIEKAEKLKLNAKFTGPVQQKVTDASGKMTEQTTIKNQLTGQDVGVPIVTEQKAADTTKAAGEAGQVAAGLRKEFYQADTIQMFNKVDAAVKKIRLSATPESTAFQDMSSIFSYMKILDPGSTVREGEYATAEKSRGWPEWARAYYNRAASGQKLTVEQKRQVLTSAEENYQGQLGNALPTIKQFTDLQGRNNFSAGTVVPVEFEALIASPAGVAASGAPAVPGAAPAGENPVVTVEQARTLPPTVKFFRLTAGGQLKWNPNHPDSPAQQRLRTAAPSATVSP